MSRLKSWGVDDEKEGGCAATEGARRREGACVSKAREYRGRVSNEGASVITSSSLLKPVRHSLKLLPG